MLEFRILGPLQLLEDGREIELGGARQRAVLAILLLHRGETVPIDRIVDLMWGERPPATAVKTVQVYVSHLRRALTEDVLLTTRGGYALIVDAQRVDAERFALLVEEARAAAPAHAAALLRTALALWRGPALGELAYERFAQDEAARLEELRLTAVEARIEADLRLGRHAGLVAELEGLVREHPLRERLRAQQMLALYRSGRQAEALDSFRAARRALVDELGLEPGRELRELEEAILAQDPALDAPRERTPESRRRGLALIVAGVALGATVAVVAVAVARHASGGDVPVLPNSIAVIDPAKGRVIADVPVGARPEALAADDRFVWVSDVADGTVQQIDIRKRRVVAAIASDVDVQALAVGGGSAWIADSQRGRVLRLDAGPGAVGDSVPLPTAAKTGNQYPTRPAVALDGGSLWVASTQLGAVLRVDVAKRRVVERVDVGNDPAGLTVGDGALWVSDSTDNNVMRIASGAVTDTIPLGNGPGPIAAGAGAVWVANSRDGTVSRIDPATRSIRAEIRVGRLPSGVAVDAGAVWVVNSLSGTVSRIDPRTNRVTRTIDVGNAPNSLTVAGGRLWVSVEPAVPSPARPGTRSVLRVLFEHDPAKRFGGGLENAQLVQAICAGLMTYASRGGSRPGELVPELATTSPAVSADGRVYTFHVRAGYRFSPPSGQPVTAAAFQRAIERTLDPRTHSEGAAYLRDVVGAAAYSTGRADTVRGVSARGDQLTIRLTRPSPTLLARLAWFPFCAVPPDTPIRLRGPDRAATAGPYYVAEAAPGKRLVLRRNPGYPGPRPRRFASIEITIGTPATRAVADVEAGRADYAADVPRDVRARLIARYGPRSRAAATGDQRYFTGPIASVGGVMFNAARPLFAGAAMRRAVNYALDRRALAGVWGVRPTDQLTPPGWPGFRDATIYPLGGPDLATARRLEGGVRRHGVLYTCNVKECIEQAAILRRNLAAIGIDLAVHRFTYGTMFARASNPSEPYDLTLWGWVGDVPDPAQFADVLFADFPTTRYMLRTPLGPSIRAASRLAGAARLTAYSTLDREISAQEAPFATWYSEVRGDFFSSRVGCQDEHPIYGIDLAALCPRH